VVAVTVDEGRPTAAPSLLALWSAPRSRSTAFLRMMTERGDHAVLHEPFSELAAGQPVRVGGEQVTAPAELLAAMRRLATTTPVFFKDTTEYRHGLLFDELPLSTQVTHTFIIREPSDAIASHYAVNPAVTRDEIGYEHLHEIFERVWHDTGEVPVVVDADALVTAPRAIVGAYCERLGIPLIDRTLSWAPEDRPEWSRTKQWHQDAANSSGFRPTARAYDVTCDNDPTLAGYLDHHLPFYEALLRHAISPVETAR
jgi:hypothetical protein